MPRLWHRLVESLLGRWLGFRLIEPESPAIDVDLPTFYVLPHASLTDEVALSRLTRDRNLPRASHVHRWSPCRLPACFALPRLKRTRRGVTGQHAPQLQALLEALEADSALDAQLVPVSVFWSRAPGKDFGFWKMLAADDWAWSGRLRRLLSVVVNGRHLEVHFGDPIRLRPLVDGPHGRLTQRKVARVLRVHFRRVRARVLGPDISHHRTLMRGVIESRPVRELIRETAATNASSEEKERRRAERYAREIASNMSYPVLRFFYELLKRLWNRLYDGVDVHGLDAVKAIAGERTLVYVPCHRSHIDYLLLSYVLYREGLMPPHIAAGRNLDMPVIGPLLRRGGAFFLRRSFKDNRLYAGVFNEYLHRLITRGHPIEYFIEGGRSRTGRMLSPRPGMLAMTLRSFARDARRDVAFVPVYVGYERVLESGSYLRELRGGKKRKESPLDLLRVIKHLREPHGRVSVNVGEPLSLAGFLDHIEPDWRGQRDALRPEWLQRSVPALGATLARRINAAASLNAVSLCAMTLLATPHHTIEADLLISHMTLLVRLQRELPGSERCRLPIGDASAWIDHVVALGFVDRQSQSLGELISARPEQATLLTWYRNNGLHLFMHFSLVAFAFRNNITFTLDELDALLKPAWPLLADELYFSVPDDTRARLAETLATLEAHSLLRRTEDGWRRQPGHLAASEHLRLLGQLVQPTLERVYLLLASLLRYPSGELTRQTLEEHSRQLAERLTLLSGLNAPEFSDRRLFSGMLDTLEHEGWLRETQDRLHFDDALSRIQMRSRGLFDPELRHRLVRLTHRPASDSDITRDG
ncbi:glycerol-3-phosphate 1-O-acyltransferase PlsB [Salinicola rhizosphaerae]|uniref:Glycerol-3-phosphate acyltransferase n=1 Tax=Salinicola rhizosphaerae TaxID=1443141 RepID=A0ABQ3E7E5_9GAMM|nr:glycerol-3-phosphate 1-O-acyltransferase PlsB [Salinicola rhizosphaerae]GHB24908.1 glycerol-3-phosphate acyltransferase [Salinicola rhizosphaerae]